MPCAPILKFGNQTSSDCKTEVGEVMSGVLEIVRGSYFSSPGIDRLPAPQFRPSAAGSNTSQRIFVRVYRTSSEHFAVLYPIRAIVTACRPLASLNLKSCSVKPLSGSPNREFRVSPRSCEGIAVTFKVLDGSSEAHMSDWIQAFSDSSEDKLQRRKKISDHRSPLPVLEEGEEDALEDTVSNVPAVSVQ